MNLGASIPEDPANRITTRIVGKCFMENTTIRTAIVIFKAFFDGPWIYYKEVPKPYWEGCWIAFLERIQPESPSLLGQMRSVWEHNMKRRYPDTMALARKQSMEKAGSNSITDCVDYPPEWIGGDIWREMVWRWSCPSWQKKSEVASNNRQAPLQGCGFVNHSADPVLLPIVKERMAKQMGRELTFKQVYDCTHKRKGTDEFINERLEKTAGNYGSALSEKYGDDPSNQPIMDAELLIPASGGIKRGHILRITDKDPASYAIKSSISTGYSRHTGAPSSSHEATSSSHEFFAVDQVQQVREEMQQKLDESERRHKEEIEQMKRVYQEQMQAMQAMNHTLMRLASMMGLPPKTHEMSRCPNSKDDDCTHLRDDRPST